ncbi:Nif3-like dinuclear metal center hexameric protein [Methanogenium cariaci]|uniref:Nif3-like dinuclear metal center hexameric protein n=1 Tax=Methanogenium cariaci TaxID=2197 RepID=UPI001FE227F3|nr:Nif3-like dinuclear metal center hexameric protein [Methanogenium cariaci]
MLSSGGVGGVLPDLIDEAEAQGAGGAFLSAELKHSVMRASGIPPLIESTHYATEAPGMRMLSQRMGWTFLEDIPPALVQR